LEEKINDLEQQSKKNTIRIFGVEDNNPRESTEKCTKQIVKLITEKLNILFKEDDIEVAHRLGVFNRQRQRSIICKLTHRRMNTNILQRRRNLKGSGVVIVEDLTTKNRDLLGKIQKIQCVRNAWTVDGKFFTLLSNGKKIKITSSTPLEAKAMLRME